MSNKYYGVYFHGYELHVNSKGDLLNPEVLQIIEFEYDEEGDNPTAIRRVNIKGEVIESPWKEAESSDDLESAWYDDSMSIQEALSHFYDWLDDNTEWVVDVPETRYQPAEYVCVGIKGCNGEDWDQY